MEVVQVIGTSISAIIIVLTLWTSFVAIRFRASYHFIRVDEGINNLVIKNDGDADIVVIKIVIKAEGRPGFFANVSEKDDEIFNDPDMPDDLANDLTDPLNTQERVSIELFSITEKPLIVKAKESYIVNITDDNLIQSNFTMANLYTISPRVIMSIRCFDKNNRIKEAEITLLENLGSDSIVQKDLKDHVLRRIDKLKSGSLIKETKWI